MLISFSSGRGHSGELFQIAVSINPLCLIKAACRLSLANSKKHSLCLAYGAAEPRVE